VPLGYGANEAVMAGSRCAAVTIGSASRPIGAGEADSRDNTSCSERSLSPETTGRVGCAIETVESVGIAAAMVAGRGRAIKRRKPGPNH